MKTSLSFAIITLLTSSLSIAKPVVIKDWALDDTNEASCTASTSRVINGQTYRLELSLDKSGQFPVEVWVREIPASGQTRAFKFTTETKPKLNFAFAPYKDSAGNEVFWQIPSDTTALIAYLKRETRALIQAQIPQGAAAPTTKAVDFSLRGSSAVIDALIEQCNKKQSLTRGDFEKAFVTTNTENLDALKLDESKTSELRTIYMTALVANSQKLQLQKDLVALNTQYAKQIQELAKVTGSLDQLTQKELTSLQAQKTATQSRIASLEQQIQKAQQDIAAKEAQIVSANATYDAAWKTIAPFEAEYKRLSAEVSTARSNVNSAQSRLNDVDSQINSKSSAISLAESDVSSLRSQRSQAENELRDLRLAADNSDSDFRRFEDRREPSERQYEHPLLQYCRNNRSDVCYSAERTIENEIDREVDDIRSRLSSTRDTARSRLQQKDDQISRLNSQIRDYTDYQIPSLRNQLSDLRNQRPALESRLSSAKSDASQASAELNKYDARVGYSSKKAALDSASAVVVGLRGELTQLDNSRAKLVSAKDAANTELIATDKKIEAVLIKIRETQDRSSELNLALGPYFQDKARIESGIAGFDAVIAKNKGAFDSILTNL